MIGRRVRNVGDVCNAPREGVVTEVRKTPWGVQATITYDAAKTVGWDASGKPVHFTQATTEVRADSIAEPGAGYSRFVFLEESGA